MGAQDAAEDDVAIIGGGVIGACCAYYLALAGLSVTLFERDQIGGACSSRNAGLIVPSYSIPIATFATLRKALRSLVLGGPFRIAGKLNLELLRWCGLFASACRPKQVCRSTSILRDLTLASAHLHSQLAQSCDFGYETRGSVALFQTKHALQAAERDAGILQELGIPSRKFFAASLPGIDPLISCRLAGAIEYPGDSQLIPSEFVSSVASLAERLGAKIKTGVTIIQLATSNGSPVLKSDRGAHRARMVVIAAGAWSGALGNQLGVHLPLQAALGYGFSIDSSSFQPRFPLLLSEAKLAATPMGGSVRFTGGFDLSDVGIPAGAKRAASIFKNIHRYFAKPLPAERKMWWSGLRPCTPDGLPVISRAPNHPLVVLATGHGMLGMTLGPLTGKLVSEIIVNDISDSHIPELSARRFC